MLINVATGQAISEDVVPPAYVHGPAPLQPKTVVEPSLVLGSVMLTSPPFRETPPIIKDQKQTIASLALCLSTYDDCLFRENLPLS